MTRAGRFVTHQVGAHARSVSEVAEDLGCNWHTVNNAVVLELTHSPAHKFLSDGNSFEVGWRTVAETLLDALRVVEALDETTSV